MVRTSVLQHEIPVKCASHKTGGSVQAPAPITPVPGIEIPGDKKAGTGYLVDEIKAVRANKGMRRKHLHIAGAGVHDKFIEGGVECARAWMEGDSRGKVDLARLEERFKAHAGLDITDQSQ
ncbi:MAG: hypothetical protein AB1576_10205 [Bacillota bacterium]